jgi:class 3 adenylate cyclase
VTECEPDATFCDACGASLQPTHEPAHAGVSDESRKIVTVVFADLVGSTSLHERLDAEPVRRVMERFYAVLRDVIAQHDGTLVKLMGDGVLAAFGVPHVREDDALRAIRASVAMQAAFAALADELAARVGPLGLRIGVNSGEVVVSAHDADVVGDPVNVAARLQQAAAQGDVVIGEATRRLIGTLVTLEPLGELDLKGRAEKVAAYRVASLERGVFGRATTFVGRDDELRRVRAAYDSALAERRAQTIVVLGSPGLGKSRLLVEVVARVARDATIVAVRCEPGGSTFGPLATALRTLCGLAAAEIDAPAEAAVAALLPEGVPDHERERIVRGIGALLSGAVASTEETFFVVRRLLAALGATRPVVFVVDDLHWAEPLVLDLIEHLAEWSTDVALLIMIAARPELRDVRGALATSGRVVRDVVTLDGLDGAAAARLAADVLGTDELPAVVAGHVLAASEGNPLFLGELVRMLVDDGSVRREGDRWIAAVDLDEIELPPTIHALLGARIERLRPEERTVLERASVIGRHFSRAAVAELLPPDQRAALDRQVEALRHAELIEPDATWFLGEPVLRFHHVLIREAAYHRLLKETRAQLHTRFADWLAAQAPDPTEHDETLGWHLEHAYQSHAELGTPDRDAGDRAAVHLAAAGRRALAREDADAAAELLGRAIGCLAADDPTRADLALDWCEALLAGGAVERARAAIAELGAWADTSPRLAAWHTCFAGQLAVLTDPLSLRETAKLVAAAATELAAAGDDAGEAKAHFVHASALVGLGEVGACEAALDRALIAARRVADWRRGNAVLAGAPAAALWGPSPLTRASGNCLDVVRVVRITSGSPAVEAVALRCQAVLEALRGRADAARRMLASSRATVEELGLTQRLLEADLYAGIVELYDDDPLTAERALRAAYDGLRERGLSNAAAHAAALLGRALLRQGRVEPAEVLSHESEALAGQGFQAAIAWRAVRAEALAARGEHENALALAEHAVALASSTDLLLDHADARLALAAVLRAAGRIRESDAETARAVDLWRAKGATALVDRATSDREGNANVAMTSAALPSPTERRVRTNRATATMAAIDAAVDAGDLHAIDRLLAAESTAVFHDLGVTYGRTETLRAFADIATSGPTFHSVPLATLGDHLGLFRAEIFLHTPADEFGDFGPTDLGQIAIHEVDDEGRRVSLERFAPDQLGRAIARLYERYAEQQPEGPTRERAATTARSMHALTALAEIEVDRIAAAYADDVRLIDGRPLGLGTVIGKADAGRALRGLIDATETWSIGATGVLDLGPSAVLVVAESRGVTRDSGGPFSREIVTLIVTDDHGLVSHNEIFAADQRDEALTRFDELTGFALEDRDDARQELDARSAELDRTAGDARFVNSAARVFDEVLAAFAARDLARMAATHAPDFRALDRRPLVQFDYDSAEYLEWIEDWWTVDPALEGELLATRGDRLSMHRIDLNAGAADVGPSETSYLVVVELDEHARVVVWVRFGFDDLDAAYDELDERSHAAEGHRIPYWRLGVALATRDWAQVADLHAPDYELVDHREPGVLTARGREQVVEYYRTLMDLAPDARLRIKHSRRAERGMLSLAEWIGSRDGGAFVAPRLAVHEFDDQDCICRTDVYDPNHIDAAFGRLDQLRASVAAPAAHRFPTAATITATAVSQAIGDGDSDSIVALCAPGFRVSDRRSRVPARELEQTSYEDFFGVLFDATERSQERESIATRGERLLLSHNRLRLTWRDFGPAEFELLELLEIDRDGLLTEIVEFDVDDLHAAFAELDARYSAIEPHAARWNALCRAINDRDWASVEELLTPEAVFDDHRAVSVLTTQGRDGVVAGWRAFVDITPDVHLLALHLDVDQCSTFAVYRWDDEGIEAASYEPRSVVVRHDYVGLMTRFDIYSIADLELAKARHVRLATGEPALPFGNAATRAADGWTAAFVARDVGAAGAFLAPTFTTFDRRTVSRSEVDREAARAGMQPGSSVPVRAVELELLATRGERLALYHSALQAERRTVGPSEVEALDLCEADAVGLITTCVRFDVEDLDAAFAELDARWAAEQGLPIGGDALQVAISTRDWARAAEAIAPEVVLEDHRAVGMFSVHGRDELVALWRAAADAMADARLRNEHSRRRGRVILTISRWTGSRDGGAIEAPRVGVALQDGNGRIARVDVYDLGQLDQALARFDALASEHGEAP